MNRDLDMIGVALAIEGSKQVSDIEDAVRRFGAPLGYDRFVLFSASAAGDDLVKQIYWVEGDWLGTGEPLDAETYVKKCPVTRHILEVREPFLWTKTLNGKHEHYRVVRQPHGPGVHGLQLPVYGPLGLEGAMSAGGEHIDASPRTRISMALLATHAFLAARRLLESPDGKTLEGLSAREREVLAWTAAGRRQIDIAELLGLSERTVENHLRRIRRRLHVTTTAQAVRVAIHNGFIDG